MFQNYLLLSLVDIKVIQNIDYADRTYIEYVRSLNIRNNFKCELNLSTNERYLW